MDKAGLRMDCLILALGSAEFLKTCALGAALLIRILVCNNGYSVFP